jgi:hypothetical protein
MLGVVSLGFRTMSSLEMLTRATGGGSRESAASVNTIRRGRRLWLRVFNDVEIGVPVVRSRMNMNSQLC